MTWCLGPLIRKISFDNLCFTKEGNDSHWKPNYSQFQSSLLCMVRCLTRAPIVETVWDLGVTQFNPNHSFHHNNGHWRKQALIPPLQKNKQIYKSNKILKSWLCTCLAWLVANCQFQVIPLLLLAFKDLLPILSAGLKNHDQCGKLCASIHLAVGSGGMYFM